MTFPRILGILAFFLFSAILIAFFFKGNKGTPSGVAQTQSKPPQEIELSREVRVAMPVKIAPSRPAATPEPVAVVPQPTLPTAKPSPEPIPTRSVSVSTPLPNTPPFPADPLPEADRIDELFRKDSKHPLVETLTYKSRVDWQKGRPAWLSDYAAHYETSRHFIARSLRGKPAYLDQDIAEGDKFNILKKDISFYLLIDTSRCKMWLYGVDGSNNERILLKTYKVGLGRQDSSKVSGLLTPLGKYTLGSKIAIYKPKVTGYYLGKKTEMITVFGTRWIPFDQEVACCTAPAKGFGIHGVPWSYDAKGQLSEDRDSIGKYNSDGCIRMGTEDIEEVFAVVITKPATLELVKDFHDAQLPGKEKIK